MIWREYYAVKVMYWCMVWISYLLASLWYEEGRVCVILIALGVGGGEVSHLIVALSSRPSSSTTAIWGIDTTLRAKWLFMNFSTYISQICQLNWSMFGFKGRFLFFSERIVGILIYKAHWEITKLPKHGHLKYIFERTESTLGDRINFFFFNPKWLIQ